MKQITIVLNVNLATIIIFFDENDKKIEMKNKLLMKQVTQKINIVQHLFHQNLLTINMEYH